MTHDDFRYADGAYILDALEPDERRAFEEHLLTCYDCARSVRALAPLPDLLSQVDPAMVDSPEEALAVPDTLLPGLLQQVRRRRRRRLTLTVAAASTAALIAGAGVVGLLRDDGAPEPPGSGASVSAGAPEQMEQLGQSVVEATVTMESVPWGTRLNLTCTYTEGGEGYGYAPTVLPVYALVVHTRDGRTEQVATWKAVPGRSTTLSAATAADVADIAAIDVRTTAGDPVLRLTS